MNIAMARARESEGGPGSWPGPALITGVVRMLVMAVMCMRRSAAALGSGRKYPPRPSRRGGNGAGLAVLGEIAGLPWIGV